MLKEQHSVGLTQERCGRIDLQRSSSLRRDLEQLLLKRLTLDFWSRRSFQVLGKCPFMACHGWVGVHAAQVRPTQEEQCDQILPCPAWRVKAVRFLAADGL